MNTRPAIRNRSPVSLPDFDAGFNLTAERARYDKLEISVDLGWIRLLSLKQINHAFEEIADASRLFKNSGNAVTPGLTIDRRKANWIFGGDIKLYKDFAGDLRLKCYLSLNVTRYFANNPEDRPVQRGRYAQHYRLQEHGPVQRDIALQGLDYNDNLIVESRLAEAKRVDWNVLTGRMVQECLDAITDEISRHDKKNLYVFQFPKNWTIRDLEIYWEFRAKDALATVDSFGKHTINYFRQHRIRTYFNEMDYDGAFVSYIFENRRQVKMAVYAKTEDRIRVECRMSYPKQIYSKYGINDTSYSRDRLSTMVPMIDALIAKAQSAAAPLKAAHAEYSNKDVLKVRDISSTLAALSWMSGHNQLFIERLIKSLLLSGRVSETKDTKYNALLANMRERGLLKSFPKQRCQPREYAAVGHLKTILMNLQK